MENIKNINKITSISNYTRKQLEYYEQLLIYNKNYYDKLTKIVLEDKNYETYLKTIYIDAYMSLNYKKKSNFLTPNERKIYKKLLLILIDEFSLFLVFQNDIITRNSIIDEASKFRKYNLLTQSKMYNLLDEFDYSLLVKIDNNILKEVSIYDLDINRLIDYIYNNYKPNFEYDILEYLNFLFLYNFNKYTTLVREIRKINNETLDITTDRIKIEEVRDLISILLKGEKDTKIYDISKNRG